MPERIRFYTDAPVYTAEYETDTDLYVFRMDFNIRSGDWRATVERASDGAALCTDRRLSPGAPLLLLGEGQFWCYGADPYGQGDLNTNRLLVVFWTSEELAEGAATVGSDPIPTLVVAP